MKRFVIFIVVLLRWFWKLFTSGLTVLGNLTILVLVIIVLTKLLYHPPLSVPKGAALVLSPQGDIVEQRSSMDPLARLAQRFGAIPLEQETTLQDILDVIDAAAADSRIRMLVLSPSRMGHAGLNQLQDIGRALERFRKSGKVIICTGDSFNQGQYYLASWADEIYLNPMGQVELHGFGLFRLYARELLDRLGVNIHVYRVGTYKSALEPFTRNDMSQPAREANQQWLGKLWDLFCTDIARNRGLTVASINNFINKLPVLLAGTGGSGSQLALDRGFIDGIRTRQQMQDYLIRLVGHGKDNSDFNQINYQDYLRTISRSFQQAEKQDPSIALLVAEGTIIYGHSGVGFIGSETLCRQIRQAREDRSIKGLVLRIDSGGGSAFAAELIRQELLLTKSAGKPVVISMGSMAASGAYWLAADADRIVASPMTLTGSIGIFGALPTFEKTLEHLGVRSDGVGTTKIAGAGNPTLPMPPELDQALQLSVENGYRQFLAIVSKGRNLSLDKVQQLAEGRVWDASTALELGLIDRLGSLADAIEEAASLTGLQPEQVRYLDRTTDPFEHFIQHLSTSAEISRLPGFLQRQRFLADLPSAIRIFLRADDPSHLFALCDLSTRDIVSMPWIASRSVLMESGRFTPLPLLRIP